MLQNENNNEESIKFSDGSIDWPSTAIYSGGHAKISPGGSFELCSDEEEVVEKPKKKTDRYQYSGYGYGSGYYDNDVRANDTGYGAGGGYGGYSYTPPKTGYYGDKYSWATSYTYTVPDHKKIKKQLKEKQKKLNRMGIPVKIMYGKESISRRISGISRISALKVSDVDKIRKFLDRTKGIGEMQLTHKDEQIMRCLYFGADLYLEKKDMHIGRSEAEKFMGDLDSYRALKADMGDKKKEDDEDEHGSKNRGGHQASVSGSCDADTVKKFVNQLKNKLKTKETLKIKSESYRSGSRINRKFLGGLSYKPLITTRTNIIPKKKALCIVDGSGSMYSRMANRMTMVECASCFMYAIEETGIFDCDTLFSNSGSISTGGKDYVMYTNGGGEGFYQLPSRLDEASMFPTNYDYIFVLSDLNIGHSDFGAIKDMLTSTRAKHIMFNFNTPEYTQEVIEQYSELKVKNIQTPQDMINTLVHYI